MDVAAVAAAHQRQQRALAARVAREAADLWRGMDPADLDRAWASAGPRILTLVASGQMLAADVADTYVDEALAAQGVELEPAGTVDPTALTGVASDGRDLSSLLYEPVISAKAAIGAGADPASALMSGLLQLDMIVRTQVADAGRVATGVAMTARPAVGGYIRVLSPPSCSRCAILAGKRFRWNAGFDRHPRCDCTAVPAVGAAADELVTNPKAYFHSLSHADQDRLFTKAGAQAIRDGGDIGQVVNARAGMYTAGGRKFTTSSTSRRGVTRGRVRLMPEQIYAEAGGDRDEAIRLLRRHGYLRGEPTARPTLIARPHVEVAPKVAAEPVKPAFELRAPTPGSSGADTRRMWEADVEHDLKLLVGKNATPEQIAEVKAKLAAEMGADFADRKIATRVTTDGLRKLLEDGRFKTQFETGVSAGKYDPQLRASIEEAMFGISAGSDPALRPIYGYLEMGDIRAAESLDANMVSAYGDVQVILRDEIRARTTVSVGDSLLYSMLPSLVDAPTWESANAYLRRQMNGRRNLGRIDYYKERRLLYVEAQIHNGVTLGDIERIILRSQPTSALRRALDQSGIAWEVLVP